jgi:hypothetical protein
MLQCVHTLLRRQRPAKGLFCLSGLLTLKVRHLGGGDDGIRTRDQRFLDACLNHLATSPWFKSDTTLKKNGYFLTVLVNVLGYEKGAEAIERKRSRPFRCLGARINELCRMTTLTALRTVKVANGYYTTGIIRLL